ncbi:MAG TPA: hypothetical protein VJC18_09125 [bacterium]|nr:hypothetical protein [bacterium]
MSFDYADVTGDHVVDIVYVTRHELIVGQFEEKAISQVATKSFGLKTTLHRVNLGDWDQDGVIEMLINGFVRGRAITWLYRVEGGLFVLEQEFDKLILPLQFARGTGLYVQAQQSGWEWSDRLGKMVIKNGKWEEESTSYQLQKGIGGGTLPLFSYAAFGNDLVAMTSEQRIWHSDTLGKKLWKSPMSYGSAVDYVDVAEKDILGMQRAGRFFIAPRLSVNDHRLLLIKNDGYLNSLLGTMPDIKSSELVLLDKTGVGFQEKKVSTRFAGIITDAKFIDFDGDGSAEVMISFLPKKGGYLEGYVGYEGMMAVLPMPQ